MMRDRWLGLRARLDKTAKTFSSYSTRKKAVIIGAAAAIIIILIPPLTYAYFVRDISNSDRLMNRNNTGLELLDRHGQPFYSFGRVHLQDGVKLNQISDNLERGVIANEDKDFYNHGGYDLKAIARSIYADALNHDLSKYGGSTITQQLVKNDLLSNKKNFLRKYQEISIAIAVDHHYKKPQILEMYLNSVYFGEGAFGIGPAAKVYFDKSPQQLDLAESSLLAGLLPAPSLYSPISGDPSLAKREQKRVLTKMAGLGYITKAQMDAALNEKLHYADGQVEANKYAKHFAVMVINELNRRYGEEKVTRSGFRVTTSLDLDWQKTAEAQIRKRVNQLEDSGGTNGALVAIDPRNGGVRALVGSVDWNNPEFGKVNMATSPRQPGSSFKPIFYAEAMNERLITPATILHDTPKTYGNYHPQEYDFRYMGDITARRALALSRNLPAVELMQKLGTDKAIEAARRMGLTTLDPNHNYGLSLGLGTAEVKLLNHTNAYAAFANGGDQYPPMTIEKIQNKFDRTVFKSKPKAKRVQSAEASYLVSSILSDPQARAPTFNGLTVYGRPVAVKTGTTDNNRDAWTMGFTPSISVGVWIGNNEAKPMSGIAGAAGAGPVWRNTILSILAGTKSESFKQPHGVEKVLVCGSTTGTVNEYFIRGTAPSQSCNITPPSRTNEEDRNRGNDNEEHPSPTPPPPPPPPAPPNPPPGPPTPPPPPSPPPAPPPPPPPSP